MKVMVFDEVKEINLDKAFIEGLLEQCDKMSAMYLNYVLSVEWDDEHNCLAFIADGPWEC